MRSMRRSASGRHGDFVTDISPASAVHIQVGIWARVPSGCLTTNMLTSRNRWRRTTSTVSPAQGWNG